MRVGWESKPLGELCEFQRGLTYGKADEVDRSSNVVLRATNVDLATHSLDLTDLRFISNSVPVPSAKKVRKGSLLICTASGSKAHLGKIAYVDDNYGYAFGGFMGQLTPAPVVEGRYLFHALTSPAYRAFIAALTDGVNINNLRFDDLRQFAVPVPSVDEQRRIVAILDEAFEAMATARTNVEKNLQNTQEWSARQLATALGAASADGRADTLEKLVTPSCSLSYGIVQPGDEVSGGLPVVRPVDLGDKTVYVDGLKRIDPALARSYARTTLEGNDLLLCVRGTTGTVATADPALAGANVTRGIVPIRFDLQTISQALGYYLLRSEPVQAQIRAKTYGTALMQINISDLRKIVIAFPPQEKQAALVEQLDAIQEAADQLTDVYTRKRAALDELKRSLLHQAFSGGLS